jgi:hypothetical protein
MVNGRWSNAAPDSRRVFDFFDSDGFSRRCFASFASIIASFFLAWACGSMGRTAGREADAWATRRSVKSQSILLRSSSADSDQGPGFHACSNAASVARRISGCAGGGQTWRSVACQSADEVCWRLRKAARGFEAVKTGGQGLAKASRKSLSGWSSREGVGATATRSTRLDPSTCPRPSVNRASALFPPRGKTCSERRGLLPACMECKPSVRHSSMLAENHQITVVIILRPASSSSSSGRPLGRRPLQSMLLDREDSEVSLLPA